MVLIWSIDLNLMASLPFFSTVTLPLSWMVLLTQDLKLLMKSSGLSRTREEKVNSGFLVLKLR